MIINNRVSHVQLSNQTIHRYPLAQCTKPTPDNEQLDHPKKPASDAQYRISYTQQNSHHVQQTPHRLDHLASDQHNRVGYERTYNSKPVGIDPIAHKVDAANFLPSSRESSYKQALGGTSLSENDKTCEDSGTEITLKPVRKRRQTKRKKKLRVKTRLKGDNTALPTASVPFHAKHSPADKRINIHYRPASDHRPLYVHSSSMSKPQRSAPNITADKHALLEQSSMQCLAQQSKFIRRLPKMQSVQFEQSATRQSVGSSQDGTMARKSQESIRKAADELCRVIKIFLSEPQSSMISEQGAKVPSAPPTTPTPELLSKYQYIASMSDVKAQRAVKTRLEIIDREIKKKEAKQREHQAKHEKDCMKEQEKSKKILQRKQIYALNKVMTELENSNFRKFCSDNNIEAD